MATGIYSNARANDRVTSSININTRTSNMVATGRDGVARSGYNIAAGVDAVAANVAEVKIIIWVVIGKWSRAICDGSIRRRDRVSSGVDCVPWCNRVIARRNAVGARGRSTAEIEVIRIEVVPYIKFPFTLLEIRNLVISHWSKI
ncbi:hypothetical protein [Pseudovibrio sp. WM33]|uniref:hypothetical protein n=1 Tax=Pseudovibrio sp. WM33 TaxID=1735585 RepID=UPI0007B2C4D0|nr:hypothetical protein [Pseudovibrio sp. WM33]KZL27908.1 hypothetical protein PsWM33_00666 [Pseudovibrio sp. WM33]